MKMLVVLAFVLLEDVDIAFEDLQGFASWELESLLNYFEDTYTLGASVFKKNLVVCVWKHNS